MRNSSYPPTTKQLTDFQQFVVSGHVGQGGQRSANRYISKLMTVLKWDLKGKPLEANEPPEKLQAKTVADKLWMKLEEVSEVYQACSVTSWPRLNRQRMALHWKSERYWRAATVLLFNYGLDWQQIAPWWGDHEHRLKWSNVCWDRSYPGDDADLESEFGWLWYVRQKTSKKKAEPLILPMNRAVRDHLISIAPVGSNAKTLRTSKVPIFDFPRNGRKVHDGWDSICAAAGVQPKPDMKTGKDRKYLLKHFRKTCSTYHNTHIPGSASLVLGHARSPGEVLTLKHYAHAGMALLEAMKLPQPLAFDSLQLDAQHVRRFLAAESDPQRMLFDFG